MIKRSWLFTILLLLVWRGSAPAQPAPPRQPYYQIQTQSRDELVIVFQFGDPRMREGESASPELKIFEIPGLPLNYQNGLPLLPVALLPLTLPEAETALSIEVAERESYPGIFPPTFQDTPNNPVAPDQQRARRTGTQPFREGYPRQIAVLEPLGLFRDYRLSALRVFPLQSDGNGVTFYKRFTVRIKFRNLQAPLSSLPGGEARLLQNFVVNDRQLNLITPHSAVQSSGAVLNKQAAASSERIKLIVVEEGIYQVTGQDLLDAGIDIAAIDASTLKLSSKGREIPLFLSGDRDGELNTRDFLEFWGEPNRRTFTQQYPDVYADPFSNENVYWLEWGSRPGLRIVEENGSLTTSRPGEFNPAFFYPASIHVEENRHFERLGQGSLERLSYTRDLWFFDSGIKAVGKRQYPFQLIHPDESSFRPVLVKVMLSGKSFGARYNGLNVPHNAMVWLNNGFVGSSPPEWFAQDTASVDNRGNSTLRTADLRHGENVLEVQLPTLPDVTVSSDSGLTVTKGTDIVLLNWFEVTYDRLYRAFEDQIEFKRPAFIPYPGVDLFQFDIDNFSNPDIEIYKKNVSKIVNFKIDVERIDNRDTYKISFQDNVPSDNIDYIAITADQKKKPLRIEQDTPFDPENPQRFLKDTANRAEYLIITHSRFFNTARELREYRREQGVAAELIDVQDIYDEFNFGIKSPLAIKAFLQYAFFNWNRSNRLKYVLLLGDSNFDYKATNPLKLDFVPTFFYQTQEFGATATDYPYSLVSGDDEIPDLFVGRIPAASNNEIGSVIAKIREHEQNAPVTSWRNQALFISGNDAGTFELSFALGRKNPAFRSQNSRVIESLLPKHISALRLNTVPNRDLPFDPNFGSDTDLIDHWDNGLFLINFLGHGGGGIWADVELMNLSDVDRLNNQGMYPFVTSMTCFTGAFENPNNLGLAQKLVVTADKGAIGVLASSGLGYLHNDYSMLWNIGQYFFDRSLTVGEIITLGKILYWSKGGQYNVQGVNFGTPGYLGVRNEMVYQYNLIGDPYVRLQFAREELALALDTTAPQRGDTLTVQINAGLSTADGYVELTDRFFNLVDRIPLFGVSQTAEVQLRIPEDFPEGNGWVRAYLSNGAQDAAGKVAFGVNHAVITAVEFQPPAPDVDDTVRVQLRIRDASGIRRVFLFRESRLDTIFAVPDSEDPEVYTARFFPTFQLETVYFNVYVENEVGNVSVVPNLSYTVTDVRPDIALIDGSLEFSGRQRTQLRVRLRNSAGAGEDGEVQVMVRFADGPENFQQENYFASAAAPLSANDSTSLAVDFPLDLRRNNFQVFAVAQVDPAEDVVDFNPANNSLSQTLQPLIYTVTGSGLDTLQVGERYRVHFPPGSVSDSSAVRIRLKEFIPPADQTGLLPVSLLEAGKFHALEVSLLNPDAVLRAPFGLTVTLNPGLIDSSRYDLRSVTLYEQVNPTQPWIATSFAANPVTRKISAAPQKSALFAPFITTDKNAPNIELTVDGRPLQRSGLVSNTPSLYVVVQDESGVNLQRETIRIALNGNPLPEEKVFIPDSLQTNNVLGMTLYPELGQGRHQLAVQVQDVNGNSSEKAFQLVVSDGFDLIVYGNYPNPFRDQTIFAYFVQLNDDLDEFEIRIYTVSGRLIRRINSDINNDIMDPDGGARRKGYNELVWDGRDETGNEVANGVYFAVVRGTYEGETIEKILRVAKLK